MNISQYTEMDVRSKIINPSITKSGWAPESIKEEYYFTPGRIRVRGRLATRDKGKRVDYLLSIISQLPLAIIEAKKPSKLEIAEQELNEPQNKMVENIARVILNAAMRGELVSQNTNEEPASVLLKRIQVEKDKLVKEGKIRKSKPLPPINKDEEPWELPNGWEWVRLGDIAEYINGRAFKPTEWSKEGLPIIRIQNLNNPNALFNYCDFEVADKYYVNNEDVLIGWSGTPGTSFGATLWTKGDAVLNQHIFKTEFFYKELNKQFFIFAINSRLQEMIQNSHGGAGLQHITKGKFERLLIPIPPLVEQKRIVEKVDKLMELCEMLK